MNITPAAAPIQTRVLVVEDEYIIAMDIAQQLRSLGYEPVGHASSGEQALELMRQLAPQLVLMDIQLDGEMDGITAAQLIREQFVVPVVFISAYIAEDALTRATLSEPFGYIVKPFGERELRAVIEMALYRHQLAVERQQVFDRVTDAFVALDKNWYYTYVNKTAGQMFNRTPEQLIGKHIWTEFPEGVGQKFHLAYEKAMADQLPASIEEYYPPYDKWFENRIYPSPEGLSIYFHDITVRKQADKLREMKELAEASSLAKSRFLAAASHDLRQPVHALGMFIARLHQLPGNPVAKEIIKGADDAVVALQNMLESYFNLSQLDSYGTCIQPAAISANALFEQMAASFTQIAAEKGLRLRFRPSTAWLNSDLALLYRILQNLISNALRYTHHGTVLVACRPSADGTHARIEVWDSGIGIAPEHHTSVFEEFFQVQNPARDRALGVGLGLSLVERSCRLLNHPLMLRSGLGCGSRFTLTVPLAERPSGAACAPAHQSDEPVQASGLQVLVIEDDYLGRQALGLLLESWGWKVALADGASMAQEQLRQGLQPDFIVSDFQLGGSQNGLEVIAMVRTTCGWAIPACLISGDFNNGQLEKQAHDAGLDLLKKPVRPETLRSLLQGRDGATAEHKAQTCPGV